MHETTLFSRELARSAQASVHTFFPNKEPFKTVILYLFQEKLVNRMCGYTALTWPTINKTRQKYCLKGK